MISLGSAVPSCAQTASTGTLTGVALDPTGALLPEVSIALVDQKTGETESTTSNQDGQFAFPLLVPSTYELKANKTDFEAMSIAPVEVHATETLRLVLHLQISAAVRVLIFLRP